MARGDDTWFFITVDYVFGHTLERETTNVVRSMGGQVLGAVRAPINTQDFSSFLLQAQASKAKVVGLANTGGDMQNAVKQASEFGLQRSGQKLAALLFEVTDAYSLGLQTAQGMIVTAGFYWDLNEETRAFAIRFMQRAKRMPTMFQAGVYSAIMHYLKAIEATGTDNAEIVIAKMKATPINDFFAKNGRIREDGRMVHDMYLMQVKSPTESKGSVGFLQITDYGAGRPSVPADVARWLRLCLEIEAAAAVSAICLHEARNMIPIAERDDAGLLRCLEGTEWKPPHESRTICQPPATGGHRDNTATARCSHQADRRADSWHCGGSARGTMPDAE